MSERHRAIPLWILAITSHCNLPVSKVTPVLLRAMSNLNIIVRLEDDANRLDTAEADIISLLIGAHPGIVYCELILMPWLRSLKKITLYNCMSSSGKMSHFECQAEGLDVGKKHALFTHTSYLLVLCTCSTFFKCMC